MVQCHESSNYCWCVNALTGEPIIGTTIKNGKPNCPKPEPAKPAKKRKQNRKT